MNKSTTRRRKSDKRDPETREAEEGKRVLFRVRLLFYSGRTHDSQRRPLDACREGAQFELKQPNASLASVRIVDDEDRVVEWWHRGKGGPRPIITRETKPSPATFVPLEEWEARNRRAA